MKHEDFKKTFSGWKRLHCNLKGREKARKDEWRCGLATFQRALAKLRNEMNHEIWKVSGRKLSHWLFSPLLLLGLVFLYSFHCHALDLISHLCCFPSKSLLRCLLLSVGIFKFGWLLPFSNHFLSSRTILSFTLRECLGFFPLTMYAV